MDYTSFSMDPVVAGVELPGELRSDRSPRLRPIDLPSPPPGDVTAHDNGEALVDAGLHLPCLACYHRVGWPGTSATTYLRDGVVGRLVEVAAGLPDGFGIAVFDGWRSSATIAALYAHYYGPGSTLEPGYLAVPDGPTTPPHVTGGAVDLTLTWQGVPLSLGSPFDEFTPRSHLRSLERPGLAPGEHLARDLRRLLFSAMTERGFAPFAEEWWHFSLGDEAWARWSGSRRTLYGPAAPTR